MEPVVKPEAHIYGISFSMSSFQTEVTFLTIDRIVGNMLYCYIDDPVEEVIVPKQNIDNVIKDINNEIVCGYFSNLIYGYTSCYSVAKEYFENLARNYELLAAHMDYEIKELKKRGE